MTPQPVPTTPPTARDLIGVVVEALTGEPVRLAA
jgi:hypothetical protein